MRNYLSRFFKNTKGFTLIELLVVIGILGVLAAALIATIDPFEQLKKAQDTNSKNTTVEFVNASIRYYTTHNNLPWTETTNGNAACTATAAPSGQNLTSTQMAGCLSALIADAELKTGFTSVSTVLSSIVVSGDSKGVTSCFKPVSQSQQKDANTKYTIAGLLTTGCISQTSTGVTTCYWCAQ